jgi:hypothetical protein
MLVRVSADALQVSGLISDTPRIREMRVTKQRYKAADLASGSAMNKLGIT